jgi:hypothetical protein
MKSPAYEFIFAYGGPATLWYSMYSTIPLRFNPGFHCDRGTSRAAGDAVLNLFKIPLLVFDSHVLLLFSFFLCIALFHCLVRYFRFLRCFTYINSRSLPVRFLAAYILQ